MIYDSCYFDMDTMQLELDRPVSRHYALMQYKKIDGKGYWTIYLDTTDQKNITNISFSSKPAPAPTPTTTPKTEYRTGTIYVDPTSGTSKIKIRKSPGLSGTDTGERLSDGDKVTVYDETQKDNYTWYRVGDDRWFADNGKSFGIKFD